MTKPTRYVSKICAVSVHAYLPIGGASLSSRYNYRPQISLEKEMETIDTETHTKSIIHILRQPLFCTIAADSLFKLISTGRNTSKSVVRILVCFCLNLDAHRFDKDFIINIFM